MYLRVFHDGVIEGLERGADVPHHALGKALEKTSFHSGNHGVDLSRRVRRKRGAVDDE